MKAVNGKAGGPQITHGMALAWHRMSSNPVRRDVPLCCLRGGPISPSSLPLRLHLCPPRPPSLIQAKDAVPSNNDIYAIDRNTVGQAPQLASGPNLPNLS